MPDRRRHRRYRCQLKVNCRNRQLAFDGVTRDICAGGVFIVTDHLPPLHSSIDLEIICSAVEPAIHCRGRVAWINAGQVETFPPGFGVEFLGVEEQIIGGVLQKLGF